MSTNSKKIDSCYKYAHCDCVIAGEDQPLTRLTNHHIYLSVKRRWSVPTVSVIWHFEPNRTKVKIAEFENDISIFHHQQFNNRLELSHSGKKLHIKNLRMEDSGNYVCTITLTNHEMYKEKFKLVVYGMLLFIALLSGKYV